ncbi:MAG: hypothetical protein KKB21_03065 [Nanoarchaeota archaeon]|nr:hypothetical protein [Nanoarchaeota archaeon]
MGLAYAREAVMLLVAEHTELTREQLVELNKTSFRANFNSHLDDILADVQKGREWALEASDERYRLKPEVDVKLIQQRCYLGAEIAFGFYNYKPSFWQGDVFPKPSMAQ